VEFDFNELRELLTVLSQTDIAELTLKSDDFELVVRREGRMGDCSTTKLSMATEGAVVNPPPSPPLPTLSPQPSLSAAPPLTPAGGSRLAEVVSPMVGTFYRAPAPDEPPFVDTGDRIRVGQTVCIIEAMKLMNEIEAEVAGEIVEILVQNGEPVEYGQVLMRVNPG
jgi:acetyl-CoA carboxylase biotin carboxyl carrier protein